VSNLTDTEKDNRRRYLQEGRAPLPANYRRAHLSFHRVFLETCQESPYFRDWQVSSRYLVSQTSKSAR
jgi:hypothetical protein